MNISYLIIFLLPFLICDQHLNAQELYWIFLRDKSDVSFDPYTYFDQKTIDKRLRHNIPLSEYTDLPLNDHYRVAVTENVTAVIGESRWMNAIIAAATEEEVRKVLEYEFVSKVESIAPSLAPANYIDQEIEVSEPDLKLMKFQTQRMKGDIFEKQGLTGKGIRIAVFDTGFPGVDTHPAFKHLRDNGQIIKTYDFLRKKENVYGYFNHGTMVLSNIAGKHDNINIGHATGAEFLLARTERAFSEVRYEEFTWIMAAEWADKNGADIISSSLGYSFHRYFQVNMDGKTSYVARAANTAASKGILVVNSAGNEAENRWGILVTPADADSVMAVGGIDPYTDAAINFSSIGPTADNRLKPNVSALGTVIAATKTNYTETQGTSFSAPLVSGFAACAWEADPEMSNMELFRKIEQAGHLYPYFDYGHGHGIPQADKILGISEEVDTTFKFIDSGGMIAVEITHAPTMNEINDTSETDISTRNLYYKLSDESGQILKYAVIVVSEESPVEWFKDELDDDIAIITVHYEGYTNEILINKK